MPDAFSDTKRITKSYIPAENAPIRIDVRVGQVAADANSRQKHGRAENAPIRIDVPVGQVATEANSRQKRGRTENVPIRIDVPVGQIATEANTRQKRGRPVGSKDKNPRKRKEVNTIPVEKDIVKTPAVVQNSDIILTPENVQVPENCENDEISINYVFTGEK